ncbi:hypothetical protein C0995_011065 [Termitomyces sp. Mi166|nr:hypothetical protein C0995_011065 [Termitomyces sp. Mi166\
MIPKPDGEPLSTYPMRKLRGLQAAIADADERYLDKSEKTLDQSPAQWEKFELEIVAQFPEIGGFEDSWPLFVILSADRRNQKQKAARKARGIPAYDAGHRRMYVGKPLLRRTVNHAVDSTPASRSTDSGVAISGYLNDGNATAERSSEVTMISYRPSSIVNQSIDTRHTLVPRFQGAGSDQLTPRRVQVTNSEERAEEFRGLDGGTVVSHSTRPAISYAGSDNARIMAVCQNKKPVIDALALLNQVKSEQLNFNALNDRSSSSSHAHRRSNDESSLLLQALLNKFDMEELMPLFHAARVTADEELMMFRVLEGSERLPIFDGEDFANVQPFQRWMLDFVLKHIDMT